MIILGGGPVALVSALRGRQLGLDVELFTNRAPSARDPPRVERVPSQVVALLVEFGVSPRRIGVESLFQQQWVQWTGGGAVKSPSPHAAHVERPALEITLMEQALRAGVKIGLLEGDRLPEFQQRGREGDCLLLDASGRSAVTAKRRIRQKRPIVARLFHVPAREGRHDADLMIAAGPEGYAYRLANATTMTLGIVGTGPFVQGDAAQIVARIGGFANWLVRDLPVRELQPGGAGAASVQWSLGDCRESVRVGDSHFARDALASQSLAMGLSDALKAIAPQGPHANAPPDGNERVALHCRRIARRIAESPFASASPWVAYAGFVRDLAMLAGNRASFGQLKTYA